MPEEAGRAELRDFYMTLRTAKGPSREIDRKIAEYFGYTERVESEKVTRMSADATRRQIWSAPGSNEGIELPSFTGSLDDAIKLARMVSHPNAVGCGWENGSGSAKIGDGEILQAATAEIALCLATFVWRLKNVA
jgi:hypothetical protein